MFLNGMAHHIDQTKLFYSLGQDYDVLGYSVAISADGETIVTGCPRTEFSGGFLIVLDGMVHHMMKVNYLILV